MREPPPERQRPAVSPPMLLKRRDFLRAMGAGATLALRPALATESDTSGSPLRFVLGAPLTHSDWMLKSGVSWGADGVRHMLDACKACGWSRIYWRVLDGGRALYRSILLKPMGRWDEDSFWSPQNDADKALAKRFTAGMSDEQRAALLKKFDALDYANFDPLAEAVRYGHEIGLEIHAWVSINEDDHGWGLRSEFSRQHPEFRWRRRDGRFYHSQLSFAFPEVRKYKLSILEEILTNYGIDGVFLDWIRTGDVRDNPQNDKEGIADYGYEEPLLNRYRELTGKSPADVPNGDPEWVRIRAEPTTEFMRAARGLTRKHRASMPLSALVGHPWHYRGELDKIDGNLRGLLLDVRAWAREGLLDAIVPAGYYRDGGSAESAWRALRDETESRVDVWTYAWVPTTLEDVSATFQTAAGLGAKQILFWEADYIDDRPAAAALKEAMRARAVEPGLR